MVALEAGAVVLVAFPFSDLSGTKVRPALVLARAGGSDWIRCQITSQPYCDERAVPIRRADLDDGSLRIESYIRPARLFAAALQPAIAVVGRLSTRRLREVADILIEVVRRSVP